jgi:hypothetical protein
MAKKKDRAFFICPRWNEVVEVATIKGGRPVARSTLRKALLAARQASGSMFDVDAYIVEQRTAHEAPGGTSENLESSNILTSLSLDRHSESVLGSDGHAPNVDAVT